MERGLWKQVSGGEGELSDGFQAGSSQVQRGASGALGQLCRHLAPPGLISRASEEPASVESRG